MVLARTASYSASFAQLIVFLRMRTYSRFPSGFPHRACDGCGIHSFIAVYPTRSRSNRTIAVRDEVPVPLLRVLGR